MSESSTRNVRVLNDNIDVYFLDNQGITSDSFDNEEGRDRGGEQNKISIDDAVKDGVFCKIKHVVTGTKLDISKLSFVLYIKTSNSTKLLTENVEYRLAYASDEETTINVIYYSKKELKTFSQYANYLGDPSNVEIRCFINYEMGIFSNVIDSEDATEFMQTSTMIYEVPVSKPLYSTTSSVLYVEDSLNNISNITPEEISNYEYTHVSKVKTDVGENYYGVKRKEWFAIAGDELGSNNYPYPVININANVVKLTPTTTQVQIYSFKNGQQYMELSNEAMAKGLTNNGKLLPHYLQSYEYMIDGTIPSDSNDYNIRFYGATGRTSTGNTSVTIDNINDIYSELYSTLTQEEEIEVLDDLITYSFVVPYTWTEQSGGTGVYKKVRSQNGITKIESNIANASANSQFYENTYKGINEYYPNVSNDVLRKYVDALEVYERTTTYTKVDKSLVPTSELLANIACQAGDVNDGVCQFYKYSSAAGNYTPLSASDDIAKIDVYAKSISYTKIASNIKTTTTGSGNGFYDDTNVKKYVQLYDYERADIEKLQMQLYYAKKEIASGSFVYFPLQAGIVNDGSIEYYASTYVKIPQDKIKYYKSLDNCPPVYIKQNYKKVTTNELSSLTEEELYKLYKCDGNVVSKENLSNTDNIFKLDIDNGVIYGTTINVGAVNEKIVPLDKDELEDIYFNKNNWYLDNEQKAIATNTIGDYGLPSKFNIVATINYDGNFENIDYDKLNDPNIYLSDLASEGKLYIESESYNEIDKSDLVAGYGVDFYIWAIGKINGSEIIGPDGIFMDVTKYISDTEGVEMPYYLDKHGAKVHYDTTTYLSAINKNGFANKLEYYTRKPQKAMSYDMFMFTGKEYYVEQAGDTIEHTGETPMLPLTCLSIYDVHDGNSYYSLSNYWNKLNDEEPLYTRYVKLRNEAAQLLIEDETDGMSYMEPDGTQYDVTDFSSKALATSTYFMKLNTYSGNHYNAISSALNGDYSFAVGIEKYKDSSYSFHWGQMQYFKDSVSHYLLSNGNKLVTDVAAFDKKYIFSKYFYQEFTKNNGVHQAKDGSFYTKISIFDGTRGTISKTLFLQPNVFNVTEYAYNYTSYAFIDVDYDKDLSSVPQSEYSQYYYRDLQTGSETFGELIQLKPEDKSPSYWQASLAASGSSLYMKIEKEMTAKYDGRSIGSANDMQVQYFDNVTYAPKIIQKDDNLFGVIFNVNLNADNEIIDPETNLFKGHISSQYPFEYDVVKLKEYIKHEIAVDTETVVLQSQKTDHRNVTVPTPFYLANEKEAVFTGTYEWNLPVHGYMFAKDSSDNYVAYDVMKMDGHWERQYTVNSIPFIVASYNFYSDPSKISNTTLSYTFTPDSKVITAVIDHPEISYKSIVRESHEVARFKYLWQGEEHDYPSNGYIQENADGTYYGLIDNGTNTTIIELTKYIDVDFVSTLKDVVHQEHTITYEYSTYKTSIALTNEKVPVLYNTELIPATSHKILYWNEDASSYAIRTITDTNAYYAYNYYYDVVPFVTTSYMRQDSAFNIEHLDELSSNMATLSNGITASMMQVSQSVSSVPTTLSELKDSMVSSTNSTNAFIATYLNAVSSNLSSITEALNNLQSTTVTDTTTGETMTMNVNALTQSIDNQNTTLTTYLGSTSSKLFEINNTINNAVGNLKNELTTKIDDLFAYESQSIAEILKNGLKDKTAPTYEEFMIELTKEMYAKIDFDAEIVDVEQKDENGNVVSKAKHKANPIDLAKKTIYRADILWQELKKKNIVE